jgi:hypothetical protein
MHVPNFNLHSTLKTAIQKRDKAGKRIYSDFSKQPMPLEKSSEFATAVTDVTGELGSTVLGS